MAMFSELLRGVFSSLDDLSFVQIGANDGVIGDPLREMILKHRWRGVCVEPLEPEYRKLVKGYESIKDRVKCENVAIADAMGERTLYRAGRYGDASTLSTERLGDKIRKEAVPVQVKCVTLRWLVDKHDMVALDLLQVDTEGYDYKIIKQIETLPCKPRAIHFEYHLLKAEKEPCFQFLQKHGYKLSRGASKRDILASI